MRSLSSLATKLIVLLAVPLLALTVVAGLGVGRASADVTAARTTAQRAELALAAANAGRQLSREADVSAAPDARSDVQRHRAETDETVAALRSVLERGSESDQLHLDQAVEALQGLDAARAAVDRQQGANEVVGTYAGMAEPVLDLDRLIDRAEDPQIVNRLEAHLALTRAIQAIAREQSLLAGVLAAGMVDATTYEGLVGLAASQRHWLAEFESTASSDDLEAYGEAEALPVVTAVQRLRTNALANGPGGTTAGDPAIWSTAVSRRLDQLEGLADGTAAKVREAVADEQAEAAGRRWSALLTLLAVLGLAAVVVTLVYRLVLRPVRDLASATEEAAGEILPAALALAAADGEHAARATIPPLPTATSDELRRVAMAFNALQDHAIELAAATATVPAAPRGDAAGVFLNFGRRTQNLVTHQLTHIDNLESRTDNPDTLADLFVLDHLATRLRRNAESLVVLAGADSPRTWSRPVSVTNVVRAAVAEAVDYSRVDLVSMTTAGAMVMGACANDVSHLLAELIDNALTFSTPETRVTIAGGEQGDGRYLVAVIDAGVGMSPAQLAEANERVALLSPSAGSEAHHFGLYVVGRLAQRHGIGVRLTATLTGGISAEVLLPPTLLVRPDSVGDDTAPVTMVVHGN